MADLETEKEGYSGLEKFMFFMIPILFTIVLLGVLLTLFNMDIRNKMLGVGNAVPFLEKVLPDAPNEEAQLNEDAVRSEISEKKIAELQSQLTVAEANLAQANLQNTTNEQTIKELQLDVEELQASQVEKAADDEQYQAKIQELSSMYAKITPSKAAPILQSMELEEMVLILNAMRPEDRVRILEKMNPQTAADATLLLKDQVTAQDRQIAALQAQLKAKQPTKSTTTSSVLAQDQLAATFNSMDPKSAGELLIGMANISPSKVLRILNAVDDNARSNMIAQMSAINDKITAQLVAKLMTGN